MLSPCQGDVVQRIADGVARRFGFFNLSASAAVAAATSEGGSNKVGSAARLRVAAKNASKGHVQLAEKGTRWQRATSSRRRAPTDIWDEFADWLTVKEDHPEKVISTVYGGDVVWLDVSYVSLPAMFQLSFVAYPVWWVVTLAVLTACTSGCLRNTWSPADENVPGPWPALSLSVRLTDWSAEAYNAWRWVCRAIPCLFVVGMPVALSLLSYPYPQEVFIMLTLVTSVFIFAGGLHMAAFVPIFIQRMRQAMRVSPEEWMAQIQSNHAEDIVHWVFVCNYGEDPEVLAATMNTVAKSRLAKRNICLMLAMEARETTAEAKAQQLKRRFRGCFREVDACFHPPNLPNDPPGKASNMCWAYKVLREKLRGQDTSKVLITVADADSDFHPCYFESLSWSFSELSEAEQSLTIFQAPVLHLKNYYRQPSPLVVGAVYTAMIELAMLADPHGIRFPYSTYSIAYELAEQVDGWDPEWIAEDWHMGIKCYLLTLGKARVQPLMLPILNYTPEVEDDWMGTVAARWAQGKRHALGFSDMTYLFMTVPLLYLQQQQPDRNMAEFWQMVPNVLGYVIRLINIHVFVGCMALYMIGITVLKTVLLVVLDYRNLDGLVEESGVAYTVFGCASLLVTLMVTLSFQAVHSSLKDRLEPPRPDRFAEVFDDPFWHWMYTIVAFAAWGPLIFIFLGVAAWNAAIKVLFFNSFDYEVASKPKPGGEQKHSAAVALNAG